MTPWVLRRPSQFRLPPPYALTSPEYAADYNELKSMGNSLDRFAQQISRNLPYSGLATLHFIGIALPRRLQPKGL